MRHGSCADAPAMAGQKCKIDPVDLTSHHHIRRLAERCVNVVLSAIRQSFHGVQATAANHANQSVLHTCSVWKLVGNVFLFSVAESLETHISVK